jgi:hypothetical protein
VAFAEGRHPEHVTEGVEGHGGYVDQFALTFSVNIDGRGVVTHTVLAVKQYPLIRHGRA